jgi:beta-galactosidase/beta-glucuronidase
MPLVLSLSVVWPGALEAQIPQVTVHQDPSGFRLQVDGRDFMVRGMNWDYYPIGTNYSYSLWDQSDDVILEALDREMTLLRSMGVNAIRVYAGIPPRWVEHVYREYGIHTVLNHTLGRYGVMVDGSWVSSTDYSDPRTRAAIVQEVSALVDEFRDVPGVLLWLLGNENNYGLSWTSFEIEDLPDGDHDAARARHLYSLFNEAIAAVKSRDLSRPVAIANGDTQYIDVIAEEVPLMDIFGANVYRGISFGDLFEVVQEKLGVPLLLTELGADAWNAREMREDPVTQARYLVGQWAEIFAQSAGKGTVGNSIGGLTFQWSDGWWKFGQEDRLDIQDTHASWRNGGYVEDFEEGRNNMNEEWWGITAKGQPDERGLYELHPRPAFHGLQKAFALDPYAPGVDLDSVLAHFATIDVTEHP